MNLSARTFQREPFGANLSARTFRRERFGAVFGKSVQQNTRKIHVPLFSEFGRSSRELCESDHNSTKSWDDRPNSPKSGMCVFGGWSTRNVVLRTQGMSCLEYTECLASKQGMSCFDIRNVLLRTQEMSCFKHEECPASKQGMSCFETRNVLLGT